MDNTPEVQTTNIPINPIHPLPSSNNLKFIIGGFVILFIGLFGGYYLTKSSISEKPISQPTGKACTQEAKICPDGSSVGRTSPNCEFSPCPEISNTQPSPTPYLNREPDGSAATANWKTYTSKCGLEFKYPLLWKVDPYFISDSEVACEYLTGPDYTAGLDSRTGTYITLSRYLVGKGEINIIDDLVHSSEKMIQPKPDPVKSVNKTFGGFYGKEFSGYGYESGISFAFLKGNYIYDISRSNQTPEQYIDQILSTFRFLDQESGNSVSQECGICGPQGIHNVDGAVCAPGLICKRGLTTSLSYCVGQDASPANCEKSQ